MGVTGIELSPDHCVIAGARPGIAGAVRVSAAHRVDFASGFESPGHLTDGLRDARLSARLPRRATVVDWTGGRLRASITAAGFEIESVLTPPEALLLLAPLRRPADADAAIAWISIRATGAAIAIVREGETLFSRLVEWRPHAVPPDHSQADLLRRYLVVAHVAPHLQQGINLARYFYGARVERAVMCGDIPDLWFLSDLFSAELGIAVGMLEAAEGIQALPGDVTLEPRAVRLAAAAAAAATAEAPRPLVDAPVLARVVALMLVFVALAMWVFEVRSGSTEPPPGVSAAILRDAPAYEPGELPEGTALPEGSADPGSSVERDTAPNRK